MEDLQNNQSNDINEEIIALQTLERYSGSVISDFNSYLLFSNFSYYTKTFSELYSAEMYEGSIFTCAHSKELDVSIIDFKLGSPAAALIIDLCSFLPRTKAGLMLGMCGGLRKHYQVGDYFVPIASIRGEGTSNIYFPPEVPALANFVVQKATTNILENSASSYHIGITHTTNVRFWEFNKEFKHLLFKTKAQAIEMECATLFAAGYKRNFPIGALLLISDLPFRQEGIKTKESGAFVLKNYTKDHIIKGIEAIEQVKTLQKKPRKGKTPEKQKGDLPHMEIGEAEDKLSE